MAKHVRRTNSSASALGGLLDTIGAVAAVELKDNPEELAKVNKMVDATKDSNFMTAAELQDDGIEAYHEAAEEEEGVPAPPINEDEEEETEEEF